MKRLRQKLPSGIFKVKSGHIEARIWSNSLERITTDMHYDIKIDLYPIYIEDQSWQSSIHLNTIKLDVRSWKELSERSFLFPKHPRTILKEGAEIPIEDFVEGYIFIFNVYNLIRVEKISFGKISSGGIFSTIEMEIEFAKETGFEPLELRLEALLTLGAVSVCGDIAVLESPGMEEVGKIAKKFLTIEDYKKPCVDEDLVKYYPSIRRP
jgi:hypothetical protein